MSKNKTRTKDKYRVVYNDTQRIELENEFRNNEYIAIPRKQEIAHKLQLSERQIKIWFQNRRAKKRKQQKRRQISTNTSASSCNVTINANSTSLSPPIDNSNCLAHTGIPSLRCKLEGGGSPSQHAPTILYSSPTTSSNSTTNNYINNASAYQHQSVSYQQPQEATKDEFGVTFVNHQQDLQATQQQHLQQVNFDAGSQLAGQQATMAATNQADPLNSTTGYQPELGSSVSSAAPYQANAHHLHHQHHHHSQHQYHQHQLQQYHHHHHHQYMQQHNHHQLIMDQHYPNAMVTDQNSSCTGAIHQGENLFGKNALYY